MEGQGVWWCAQRLWVLQHSLRCCGAHCCCCCRPPPLLWHLAGTKRLGVRWHAPGKTPGCIASSTWFAPVFASEEKWVRHSDLANEACAARCALSSTPALTSCITCDSSGAPPPPAPPKLMLAAAFGGSCLVFCCWKGSIWPRLQS